MCPINSKILTKLNGAQRRKPGGNQIYARLCRDISSQRATHIASTLFFNKNRTQAAVYTSHVTQRQCGMFSRDVGYVCALACYWGCCWSNKSVRSARSPQNTKYVMVIFVRPSDRPTDRLVTKKVTACMHTVDCQCGKQNTPRSVGSSRRWRIAALTCDPQTFRVARFLRDRHTFKETTESLCYIPLKQLVPRVTDSCPGDRAKLLAEASCCFLKIFLLCLQQ